MDLRVFYVVLETTGALPIGEMIIDQVKVKCGEEPHSLTITKSKKLGVMTFLKEEAANKLNGLTLKVNSVSIDFKVMDRKKEENEEKKPKVYSYFISYIPAYWTEEKLIKALNSIKIEVKKVLFYTYKNKKTRSGPAVFTSPSNLASGKFESGNFKGSFKPWRSVYDKPEKKASTMETNIVGKTQEMIEVEKEDAMEMDHSVSTSSNSDDSQVKLKTKKKEKKNNKKNLFEMESPMTPRKEDIGTEDLLPMVIVKGRLSPEASPLKKRGRSPFTSPPRKKLDGNDLESDAPIINKKWLENNHIKLEGHALMSVYEDVRDLDDIKTISLAIPTPTKPKSKEMFEVEKGEGKRDVMVISYLEKETKPIDEIYQSYNFELKDHVYSGRLWIQYNLIDKFFVCVIFKTRIYQYRVNKEEEEACEL